jgi:hypothetical protein
MRIDDKRKKKLKYCLAKCNLILFSQKAKAIYYTAWLAKSNLSLKASCVSAVNLKRNIFA